ncbi:hypothetical protein [Actinoplanes sp. URMC 104]|uniref:hypothetical protein n=1 Tax=Actinoplanes sp. URMC 104 TaxID=3423409 RepID=UPI003F1AF36F
MNEDEQQLRDRLEAITPPPSRLEVDALVDAGRRRSFRRRSWQAAGGVALATGALVAVPAVVRGTPTAPPAPVAAPSSSSPASPAAVKCRTTTLRAPTGAKGAAADGVDPTGRYVIGHWFEGQNFRPILWTDGVPKALPTDAPSLELSSVNARGVVAGLASEGNRDYVVRYENGEYTRMRTPTGSWHVYPVPVMNAAGDIVINAEPQGNSGGEGVIALLWKAGAPAAVKLPLPAGAHVYDITDDGTIVGGIYEDGMARVPYAWDEHGNGRRLQSPAGSGSVAYAAAGTWATGGVWPAGGDGSPVRWNLTTGKYTRLTADGPGDGVNSSGWILAAGKLFRDTKPVTLPAPRGQLATARGVSDTGLVVGHVQTVDDNGTVGARAWQC